MALGRRVPAPVRGVESPESAAFTQTLSLCLAVLLIATYGLGLLFSLQTHREFFGAADHAEADEVAGPIGGALATPPASRCSPVSEFFVESVQARHWSSG